MATGDEVVVEKETYKPAFAEFVIIVSLMMSLPALSIDAMLPALPDIGSDLMVRAENDRQLVVSALLLGMAVGQLFFGPLSDRTGRKPAVYGGYVLYIAGSLLSAFSGTFQIMLAGRLLQGIGVSSPRAITLAIVRDRYAGERMAQVMSFVMTVFILIPMIAPTIGQGIIALFGWRGVFGWFVVMALISPLWFAIRLPETLAPEHRSPFSIRRIISATIEVLKNRTAFGYTLSAGFIGGAFFGYLNSSQQIFEELYELGDLFALFFAIVALSIGSASFSNARLVMRYGMRFLVIWSLRVILTLAIVALVIASMTDGKPPLPVFMVYVMMSFFCVGILFGNQNALAMEPLGHLAGIGAALVGSVSTLISVSLGTFIGRNYNETLFPLIIGLAVLSAVSIVVVTWVESKPKTT